MSGTAQLISDPSAADAMFLPVYIAPAKNLKNGFCQVYSVKLTGPDDSNEVTGVEVCERKLKVREIILDPIYDQLF